MKKLVIIVSIIVFLAAVIAGAYFYYSKQIKISNGSNKKPDIIEIHENSSSLEVARDLEKMGAIKSAWLFYFCQKLQHKSIMAGFYTLRYDLSINELLKGLSSEEYLLTVITVPEGKRLEQIAALVQVKNIFGYKEFLTAAHGNEGRLSADTYYLSKKTTVVDFVKMMADNFAAKTAGLQFTPEQLVLASMVERESNINDQKATIAGIFQNRLNIGMKLQSDPTVYFVNDSINITNIAPEEVTQYVFWHAPSVTFRSLVSLYNTYIYEGLPPEPICTPSLTSLMAAIKPEKNNYFYFLHDKDGNLHPASTLQEHEDNVTKYLK